MVFVFVSLSKIPCTCHQIGYLENTDEVPNFLPQGLGTLSNSWGLEFVCSLIPLVPMPSPPPPPPPHTHWVPITQLLVRDVPEDKFKVRRGWAWEGVSPSHMLEKNQDMN